MANVYAVKSGNWSDTTVWNTGALPTSADDVYANTYTVTVDISPTVLTVRNTSATGITAGGTFSLANGVNLTCTNVLTSWTSGTNLIVFGLNVGNQATITANSSFSISNTSSTAIVNSGTGTLNYIGYLGYTSANAAANRMLSNTTSGVVNIVGNVFAGAGNGGTATFTISNSGSGTINITGLVYSTANGVGANSTGCISNSSLGTINITGNCTLSNTVYSSNLVNNSSTGQINITGQVFNNTTDNYTVLNNSSGTLTITGTITAQNTIPAIAPGSTSQNTYLTGPFVGTAQGVVANAAYRWRWIQSVGSSYMTAVTTGAGGTVTGYKNLYTADSSLSNSGQPAASNVRSGVIYGPNSELTGTMVVPATNTVLAGVSVGNTVGTAQFATPVDFWNIAISGISTSGSIGNRLKNAATVSSVATILSNALR